MTRAQFETLAALQSAGIGTGDYFLASIFPASTNEDRWHRRTLASLKRAGWLGPGKLPWVSNAYQMLPGTYERASRYAAKYVP